MGKTILITLRHIQETEVYKNLSTVGKKIVQNKTTVKHIAHGVNVSVNIGFEKWESQTHYNAVNNKIVKELWELKKQANDVLREVAR